MVGNIYIRKATIEISVLDTDGSGINVFMKFSRNIYFQSCLNRLNNLVELDNYL